MNKSSELKTHPNKKKADQENPKKMKIDVPKKFEMLNETAQNHVT